LGDNPQDFVSHQRRRLAATLVALMACLLAGISVHASPIPDSTWVQLPPLPQQGRAAIFSLAVAPDNNHVVIAANSQGSLLRSTDGGSTWTSVHTGRAGVVTIAFSPFNPAIVLAGTHGSGALASRDGGVTWAPAAGLDGRTVRVFGFALTLVAAGTDHGVYASPDGFSWAESGLHETSISALAVAAIHPPVRLVVGGDSPSPGASLPMYQSTDGGATWGLLNAAISGSVVARLAAGPLPPTGNIRPLIVGTNAGLFTSADNGSTFTPLSGGEVLPTTDYTQLAFVTDHYDHFYTASDGGGSQSGGLWFTADSGQHFKSMVPPLPSITALAVSNDETPYMYVAIFRPSDHGASLWTFHDTGGIPQGPGTAATPSASGARPHSTAADPLAGIKRIVLAPQAPYVGLGIAALLILGFAVISHFRGRQR
jgi:photosystem II stability/assembly factor-like uncharacterized protein